VSPAWGTIVAIAAATFAIKAAGPVFLGARELPEWTRSVIALLASALLAALVVTQALSGDHRDLVVDARVPALALAGVAIALRASPLIIIAIAALAAAALRAIF
jgi:branched-subunit amino acid transport protein